MTIMSSKQLSIILPVFNVEEYLERCVVSLLRQNLMASEYEIIVVNDGSPDKSGEVAQDLMSKHASIRYFEQVNQGVSAARNKGISVAEGAYLLFVDPDDYVLALSLEQAIKEARTMNLDIYFLGYTFLDAQGQAVASVVNTNEAGQVLSGIEAYHRARADFRIDPDRSVGILYRNDFLKQNSLTYPRDIPYLEDGEFLARSLCVAKRCSFSGRPFYVRTTRPGSATNSNLFYSEEAVKGFGKAAVGLKLFQGTPGLSKEQRQFLNQPIAKFALLTIQGCTSLMSLRYVLASIRRLKLAGLSKLDTAFCKPIYRRYGQIYNISPFLFWAYFGIDKGIRKLFSWR